MKVGFFHASTDATVHTALAKILIASVRRAMPGVAIVHFTDMNTKAIDGVDDVHRREAGPIALSVLEHYASVAGDWLFVDTDVVVLRDVQHVFHDPIFDIAVATREGTLKDSEVGTKFMASMPFNKGVVFSRARDFWMAAASLLRRETEKQQTWMGDQRAMNDVIAAGRFAVKILAAGYNYPPKFIGQPVRAHHILHFKGPRKSWMQQRRSDWP